MYGAIRIRVDDGRREFPELLHQIRILEEWISTFMKTGYILYLSKWTRGRATHNPHCIMQSLRISYLLTYAMAQSPSWEANWFAASQEILRILWNPKVHYRTHKRPPPVPILGQPNPVHITISHLLEIHSNIIHPSKPRSPQWSLSLRFPHQDPVRPLSSPIRATCPAHLILLDSLTLTLTYIRYCLPFSLSRTEMNATSI